VGQWLCERFSPSRKAAKVLVWAYSRTRARLRSQIENLYFRARKSFWIRRLRVGKGFLRAFADTDFEVGMLSRKRYKEGLRVLE